MWAARETGRMLLVSRSGGCAFGRTRFRYPAAPLRRAGSYSFANVAAGTGHSPFINSREPSGSLGTT